MTSRSRGTAFVFDRIDAESFVAVQPDVEAIVSLTPSGRVVLDQAGLNPIPSDRIYSDCAHARVVARLKRARGALERRIAEYPSLDSAAAQMLVSRGLQVAAAAAAFWQMLRGRGPWVVLRDGCWDTIEDQSEAHKALLARLVAVEGQRNKPQPRFFGIVARLAIEIAGLLSRTRGTVALVSYRRGMRPLIEAIERHEGLDVITLGLSDATLKPSVAHALKLVFGERNGLRVLSPYYPDPQASRIVTEIASGPHEDCVVARGYAAFVGMLVSDCGTAATIASNFSPILRRLRTRAVLSWDHASPNNVGLAEAGRRAGATVVVAGHATAAIPRQALDVYFRDLYGMIVTGAKTADLTIAQSPAVAAVISRIEPNRRKIKAMPFLWGEPLPKVTADSSEPALFVWAGNFHRWVEHRAWVDETADEMLDALIRLAQAVIAVPALRLEVRIKPNWRSKNEIDKSALEYFLPKHERLIVRSEGSFAESLSRACAVVSCTSTAIDEAFRGRVPVVLWGARNRAPFLPARSEPPTPTDRAAVYAPPWRRDLSAFLSAIATAHRRDPLSDHELRGFVWDDEAANYNELARQLCTPKVDDASCEAPVGALPRFLSDG